MADPLWLTGQDLKLIGRVAMKASWQLAHLGNGGHIGFSEKELADLLKEARKQGRREAKAKAKKKAT